MDPVELRLKNYSETDQADGDKPLTLPEGLRLAYDKVREAAGWQGRPESAKGGRIRKGVGFAAHDWGGGRWPPARLRLDRAKRGRHRRRRRPARRISAPAPAPASRRSPPRRLACRWTMSRCILAIPRVGPYAPVSSGSATQATIGPAIQAAAADIRDELLDVAANAMEIAKDRLSVRDGMVLVDGDASRGMSVKKVMQEIAPNTLRAQGARVPNPATSRSAPLARRSPRLRSTPRRVR